MLTHAYAQEEGNYRIAHSKLFNTVRQLEELHVKPPQELMRSLVRGWVTVVGRLWCVTRCHRARLVHGPGAQARFGVLPGFCCKAGLVRDPSAHAQFVAWPGAFCRADWQGVGKVRCTKSSGARTDIRKIPED
eukprot:scaffold4100_cov22-Tisochrysis_lutea.AAC.1